MTALPLKLPLNMRFLDHAGLSSIFLCYTLSFSAVQKQLRESNEDLLNLANIVHYLPFAWCVVFIADAPFSISALYSAKDETSSSSVESDFDLYMTK